ncbi:isoprenylcysteine carboxylmethyltransferase family protein [Algoriphagus sp.]|uniref:methyltransferase family protein n=1 Tax=Algoriphagus sp. TaxID=1872435 RepID=UPI00262D06C1|nr:isoprenylcysteine carboxylmethyltransferase family protein [Algoriphagus sp.]
MEYLLLAGSWAIFYGLHSFLASSKLKRILKEKLASGYKWYRLFYSTFSILLFLAILIQAVLIKPDRIFKESNLIVYLGYLLATFGTILSVKSSKAWSIKQFLGLNPASPEKENLIKSGLYGKIRHPLYAGLLLIALGYLLVAGTGTAMIHLACLVIYLPIGIYFEEKNLMEKFGDSYKRYQQKVPPLIPSWRK